MNFSDRFGSVESQASLKMLPSERLFAVLAVSGIILGKNLVNGSRDSCPKSALVDLTDETPNSSGAVNKSGILFPRAVIRYDKVGKFGCMCDIKICRPFCCPFGDAAGPNGCLEDKYTSIISAMKGSVNADVVYVFVHDPCQLSFIEKTSMKKYNRMLANPQDIYFREYCLLREVDSIQYLYGICLDKNILSGLVFYKSIPTFHLTCEGIRASFILATLIVYSVTPKLRNLQGLLLRCQIGSEVASLTLYHVLSIWIDESLTLLYQILTWVIVFAVTFFNAAHMFWLTMLNFDVWWKFRKFRSNRRTNSKEYEKGRFMWYSIYTWGGSIIAASLYLGFLIWLDVADPLTKSTIRFMYLTFVCFLPLPYIICAFSSVFMFTSTALTIRRQKKEIAHTVNDVDRRHKDDMSKQRFNLYLGLLTLMGCHKVIDLAAIFSMNPVYMNVRHGLGALHGVLTFLIFVWKDDMKQSFRSQVMKILQKWRTRLQPHPKHVAENKKETS